LFSWKEKLMKIYTAAMLIEIANSTFNKKPLNFQPSQQKYQPRELEEMKRGLQ
jgi:hypothetical protein